MDWVTVLLIVFLIIMTGAIIYDKIQTKNKKKALNERYNVSKFPVTSLMGNQYFAEIIYNHDNYRNKRFECNAYIRSFKNGKVKDERILNRDFTFKDFDYDYIKVVKSAIGQYEEQNKLRLQNDKYQNETIAVNKKLFDEWDGVIKEEETDKITISL